MTKCQAEKDAADSRGGRPMVGGFTPQCSSNGSYERKQCHGSTGYCWCVNEKTGKEIAGTKKGPGQGTVDCSGMGFLNTCDVIFHLKPHTKLYKIYPVSISC